MRCTNNLKQIGIAALHCEGDNGVLPPLAVNTYPAGTPFGSAGGQWELISPITVSGPYKGAICYTVFCFLLSYMEQGQLDGRSVLLGANGQTVNWYSYIYSNASYTGGKPGLPPRHAIAVRTSRARRDSRACAATIMVLTVRIFLPRATTAATTWCSAIRPSRPRKAAPGWPTSAMARRIRYSLRAMPLAAPDKASFPCSATSGLTRTMIGVPHSA